MLVMGIALLGLVQSAHVGPSAAKVRTAVVQPGPQYQAGWFRRLLFGDGWRTLWVAPVEAPVADLDALRGGLTPYERGGSGQTLALRFCTPDGRSYQFRSVDKNPGQQASGFRRTPPVRWIYRNHISAMFPAGALTVGELERTAGLIPTERWLAVLPDSPRLGKWHDDFKGMLGVFERRLLPSEECVPEVPDFLEVVSSDTLLARLQTDGGNWVDEPSYLMARLFDLVVNDPDRHGDQWSWVRVERDGLSRWLPVPRDRDWALSHNDGLIYALARPVVPAWVKFGPRYAVRGLTMRSEYLDRLLLSGLDRKAWDSATAQLRMRLNDTAIAAAVAALPAQFDKGTLERLAWSLASRRDHLPDAVSEFYARLSRVVDIHATDGSELAEVTRAEDGSVLLELFAANRTPVLRRQFLPSETSEIRLYLRRGADSVRVRGNESGIPIRVITGGGSDFVTDSTGGRALRVYDDSGSATVEATGEVRRIVRPLDSPLKHDWGHRFGLAPWFKVRPEVGVILGGGPVLTTYGFRKAPYQSRVTLRLGTTTKAGELNADLKADLRFERPDRRVLLKAEALNADVIRYFGLGNETVRTATSGLHHVIQRQYSAAPAVQFGIGGAARLELGGLLRWSETDETRITQLSVERPYGTGSFTEAALTAAVLYDSRDDEMVPTKGVTLELAGRVFPAALDVATAFSSVSLVGTTYLTAGKLPLEPTLALRVGAQRVFGTYPFFEAAHIGGRESLRGLTTRRYAGDAAVYGNSELRLKLNQNWGVLGLADVGRVFLEGESSNQWRAAVGGGIWIAPLTGNHMISATLAGSGERLRFYVNTGFHF
jgi:hypothetical protein